MLRDDPLWFKDAVLYELHVRAFHDSDGDGYGDFTGLTQKLDYLQDLGVTALWLLPFYPSPLRDDGYDIADYENVHPDYGTMDSFREFLNAAHARGLRVITELVINHTSDQHPWFQRARRAPPGSPERDFYVWSETPEKYRGVRIIFQDFEPSNWTYDHIAKSYFWHRFYSHQPDLNYDNPLVHDAILPLVDYWFNLGVDGLRLDAVPYLYEREGTNCENLPETHAFLKKLRAHVDAKYPDRMFLAEANQWPEDAAAYFGAGDECHMAFHFPVMPRLFMAMHIEDRFPIVDILQQTPKIPDNCQWAVFLRNHDELTLEMVTDEERDYMYRAYASDRRARINLGIRRRLAPLLGNNRRRIELMNGLLFSLPGTPVMYYGDEIGMGDNIFLGDRNGVRTPMQWSGDRNAGFSRANPQRLYLPITIDPEYHYEAVNVEAQQENASSLLWWHKRLIALRQQHPAFSRGDVEFLDPHNRKILAFIRRHAGEAVLVVANLSRFVQYVELDLRAFEGVEPIEMFGSTEFPRIGRLPYLLTMGPHAFYWFTLRPQAVDETTSTDSARTNPLPAMISLANWEELYDRSKSRVLADVLGRYLRNHQDHWSLDRRMVRTTRIRDSFRFEFDQQVLRLQLVDLEFNSGEPETIVLRSAFATDETAAQWTAGTQPPLFAHVGGPNPGVIYNAAADPLLLRAAYSVLSRQGRARGEQGGEIVAWSTAAFRDAVAGQTELPEATVTRSHHNNQTVVFGKKWVLKMLRGCEEGPHPEVELGRLFPAGVEQPLAPALVGAVEYRGRKAEARTLGVLHEYVPHESDAWRYTLDVLGGYFEQKAADRNPPPLSGAGLLDPESAIPDQVTEGLGDYLENMARLGGRLGELHRFLAEQSGSFAPEPFSLQYQRSRFQSIRGEVLELIDILEKNDAELPPEIQSLARRVIERESTLHERLNPLLQRPFASQRIRCHGDCHLAQVLFTGKNFTFIDFEGPALQPLGERRIKRSPLLDVASMLGSFHAAALYTLHGLHSDRGRASGVVREGDRSALEPWAEWWRIAVSRRFLAAYAAVPRMSELIPSRPFDLEQLLEIFRLEYFVSAAAEEAQHRPKWLVIPLSGLLGILETKSVEAVR